MYIILYISESDGGVREGLQTSLEALCHRARAALVAATALMAAGCTAFDPAMNQRQDPLADEPADPGNTAKPFDRENPDISDPRGRNNDELVAYIRTSKSGEPWTDKGCRRLAADFAGSKVTRWIILDSATKPMPGGSIKGPKLRKACAESIGALAKDSHVSLAVGGWDT